MPPNYIAEKDRLIYTIRFQNTGTLPASFIMLRDVIPATLDITSLKIVNASHPYKLTVRDKNIVEVYFANIQLPDSTFDEANSHGFVQFSIKPKTGLALNAAINNSASIFFDYNNPVITNTATTRVQITTGIPSNKKMKFNLFPNPSNEKITVALPFSGNGKWALMSIDGKIISMNAIQENTTVFDIDVNSVPAGTYLLSLEINGEVSNAKLVIAR